MKSIPIGGSGDIGRMAVISLLSSPKVTSIIVTDKNYELARTFGKKLDLTSYPQLKLKFLDL